VREGGRIGGEGNLGDEGFQFVGGGVYLGLRWGEVYGFVLCAG